MHHIGTIIDFAIIVLKIGLIKKNILNCCIFFKNFCEMDFYMKNKWKNIILNSIKLKFKKQLYMKFI
jgi:hypothetical protein